MEDSKKNGIDFLFDKKVTRIKKINDKWEITINGNHKIINKIINAKTVKSKEKIASQIYDLALLSQNMLSGSDLTNFVRRSINILGK